MERSIVIFIALLGAFMFANGIFMLVAPEAWFSVVPGVTRTGFFNQHFVRDIGMTYLMVGSGFIFGGWVVDRRVELWGIAALWLSGHAIFHLVEVATGICSPSYLLVDFPAVTLPALIGVAATLWAAAHRKSALAASR
ncbi:hypothetical protein [Sphingopyxis granuli]|uniref:hypothetical protein n=1 Tax=Sphingopyxis granuli TaxID=267128 RepID=UPI001BAEA06F|nr:hypothetical protein [Sphingopyxis granuli]QUM74416.1 hypothetical protein ICN83_19955 [Sphingopyxis granuli]